MKKIISILLASMAFSGVMSAGNSAGTAVSDGKDSPVKIYNLGQYPTHPNYVVADIENYGKGCSAVWFEDGKKKGNMLKIADNVYAATPATYAENVTIVVKCGKKKWTNEVDLTTVVDAQAHRGGMGLYPENSIAAMKNAVDLGVNTLEMDLCVSKDGQILLSHDPYFHHRYSTRPDGTSVKRNDPKDYLYLLTYDEIKKYDTGLKYNPDWPEKKLVPTVKPLLLDVIAFVENYTKEKGLSPMKYNIEIKSDYGDEEGTAWPEYKQFVDYCAPVLASLNLGDRLVVQSFDDRALNYLHEKYPEFVLSYLIRDHDVDFDKFMGLLNFTPEWLSPPHSNVTEEFMKEARKRGMKVVTWTVDEPEEFERLMKLNVDGIISNYPDRLLKATRGN